MQSQTKHLSAHRLACSNIVLRRIQHGNVHTDSTDVDALQSAWKKSTKDNGPLHERSLGLKTSFGYLLYTLHRFEEAEPLMKGAVEETTAALGRVHAMPALNNYALLLLTQGKLLEAEKSFLEVLKSNNASLGPTDPQTMTTLHNLGELYTRMPGRRLHGIALLRQALEQRHATLGADCKDTLEGRVVLGAMLGRQPEAEYCKEGEALLRSALSFFTKSHSFGQEHPLTNRCTKELGCLLCRTGRYSEALGLLLPCRKFQRSALSPAWHPLALETMDTVAWCWSELEQYKEEEAVLRERLAAYRAAIIHIPVYFMQSMDCC